MSAGSRMVSHLVTQQGLGEETGICQKCYEMLMIHNICWVDKTAVLYAPLSGWKTNSRDGSTATIHLQLLRLHARLQGECICLDSSTLFILATVCGPQLGEISPQLFRIGDDSQNSPQNGSQILGTAIQHKRNSTKLRGKH